MVSEFRNREATVLHNALPHFLHKIVHEQPPYGTSYRCTEYELIAQPLIEPFRAEVVIFTLNLITNFDLHHFCSERLNYSGELDITKASRTPLRKPFSPPGTSEITSDCMSERPSFTIIQNNR
ncbi:hypothetical protein ANN_15593 [Periplaneta americana]|uniref:Uncharacterized protein n=1 Tax=Periplaneta americana TaxID=6978 RepID=A0ABQ8SGS4_PERAM|nr:hypothetical protein ANN_15593 [Periplaneta americana]